MTKQGIVSGSEGSPCQRAAAKHIRPHGSGTGGRAGSSGVISVHTEYAEWQSTGNSITKECGEQDRQAGHGVVTLHRQFRQGE